jgi:hypothetical protein
VIEEAAKKILAVCSELDYYQFKGAVDVALLQKEAKSVTVEKKSHCLDRAIEVFKHDQSIPVLELAKQFEGIYRLLTLGVN